jgi:D-xylose transport system substrate-binding protein
LEEHGLAGKVPVSGQDASLAGCQYILQGKQAVSVYKPIRSIAEKAAQMAVDIAHGHRPETTGVANNGKIDVPSYLIDVVAVTSENINDTVIKDGFRTYEELYPGAANGAR